MTERVKEEWLLIGSAIDAISGTENRAWRTHIQKLVYLACSWSIVREKPYEFVIHQFGPYSYGLDRNISEMEAFGVVQRRWGEQGRGSHYSISEAQFAPYTQDLRGLADWLGSKSVKDLEVLATVEFVRRQGAADISDAVRRLKPHISRDAVEHARVELDSQRALLGRGTG